MRFPKPCLGCQRLHTIQGDYCEPCRLERVRAKEADPNRRAKKHSLYAGSYPARRRALVDETVARGLVCHICKQPFTSREQITADHLLAGNPNSPLAPAHKSCNSSRGDKALEGF